MLQLVLGYNHLVQCRAEGAIHFTKSHARVALQQSGALCVSGGLPQRTVSKKRNTLWTHTEGNGKVTTSFKRMLPVGGSNNHRFIAVPFGCKRMVQIPRESSLCTDDSHGSRAMEGIPVGANHSTNSIHVYLFKNKKDAAFLRHPPCTQNARGTLVYANTMCGSSS